MPSSHDPVIRMLHCLFIVLKIPLFSMPSSHDPVIGRGLLWQFWNASVFQITAIKWHSRVLYIFIILGWLSTKFGNICDGWIRSLVIPGSIVIHVK
jgi:hypothetical protein